MIRNTALAAAFLSLSVASAAPAWADEAREEETAEILERDEGQQTLADRIPSVTSRAFVKSGRVQLTPQLGLSLNDPFYQNYVVGGAISYNILESLFVRASGSLFLATETTPLVTGGSGTFDPNFDRPVYSAGLELGWAPFYGKMSLLAESVLHFDTFIAVGGGVIGPDQGDPVVAATVAVGQHYFLNEWMALRLEIRDQIYSLDRAPLTANEEAALQNLITFNIGVAFFVPSQFEREQI